MNKLLTMAGVGVAAYVVWVAARVGAGACKRPRPALIDWSFFDCESAMS